MLAVLVVLEAPEMASDQVRRGAPPVVRDRLSCVLFTAHVDECRGVPRGYPRIGIVEPLRGLNRILIAPGYEVGDSGHGVAIGPHDWIDPRRFVEPRDGLVGFAPHAKRVREHAQTVRSRWG